MPSLWLTSFVQVAAMLLSALAVEPVCAEDRLTQSEWEALPSEQVRLRGARDLLSVLVAGDATPRAHGDGNRRAVFFTRPVDGRYAGVCALRVVTVHYAPDVGLADRPLHPHDVEVETRYRISGSPDISKMEVTPKESKAMACDRLSPGNWIDRWLIGFDDQSVAQGAILFSRAMAALKSGEIKLEPCPGCEPSFDDRATVADLRSITPACLQQAKMLCYEFVVGRDRKVIEVRARAADTWALPEAIVYLAVRASSSQPIQGESFVVGPVDKDSARDLLSLLPDRSVQIKRRNFVGVTFRSKSIASDYDGICRRDQLLLVYGGRGLRQPYDVSAETQFYISTPPNPNKAPAKPTLLRRTADCDRAGASDDQTGWRLGSTEFEAAQGALLLNKALIAIAAGKIKPQGCASCERLDQTFAFGNLLNLYRCVDTPAPGEICYAATARSADDIRITARGDDNHVAPGEILSVAVGENNILLYD
jgi:hypothetical protein